MPQGIIREGFTCDFTVYPFGDVRGRWEVAKAFADRLVATGLWSIYDESIPTANYTVNSTLYIVWLKFGASNRYLRVRVRGGTGTNDSNMDMDLLQAGSTTAAIRVGLPVQLSHSTLGYTRVGLQAIYGASWMILQPISYGLGYVDITAVSSPACFQTFEDFITPGTTKVGSYVWGSAVGQVAMTSAIVGSMYFDDSEYPISPGASYIPPANPDIELLAPAFGPSNTNWRRKDVYGFSNKIGVVVGSVLAINGHYFMLMSNSLIADLGAIP